MGNNRLSSKLNVLRMMLSKFSVLACLISVVLLLAMWEGILTADEIIETPHRAHYYNEIMARRGQNYPICMNIDALEKELIIEEKNRVSEEQRYEDLLLHGQMNCGNIRVGLGIFSKRYILN